MIDDQVREACVRACLEYDHCASEIARLTRAIGDALSGCARAAEPGGENHLTDAYATIDDGPDNVRFLSDVEQAELLAPCPACARAHELIQQRKAMRIRWGAAKRRVRAIARRAAAPEPAPSADPFPQLELV